MSRSVDAFVLEPFTYTRSVHGKGVRPRFLDALNIWLNVPADKIEIINDIISVAHDSSLMLDDIQDGSPLRRGHPAAHKVYGESQTISAVNYALFQCYERILAAGGSHEQMNLFPLFDVFVAEVLQKTGAPFRLMIRLMTKFATTNQDLDYIPLGNLVAAFFQIRDDYMNLQSAEYTANKGFAEDLTEGKFSFPVIHSIHADKTNQRVLNVLENRPSTPTLKIETIAYMRDHTRSMDYTLSVLVTLLCGIQDEIRRLGGNEILESLVNELGVYKSSIIDGLGLTHGDLR